MDHRGTLLAIQHDQLQQVPGAVGPEDQVAPWLLTNLLDHESLAKRVLDVLIAHPMTASRWEHLHAKNRTTEPARTGWQQPDRYSSRAPQQLHAAGVEVAAHVGAIDHHAAKDRVQQGTTPFDIVGVPSGREVRRKVDEDAGAL